MIVLIPRKKLTKFLPPGVIIFRLNVPKFDFGWGSAPNPAGGAYSPSPDPLAGGSGLAAPSPRTTPLHPLQPHPCLGLRPRFSAFRASDFGAFGASWRRLVPPNTTIPLNSGAARIHTVWGYANFLRVTWPKPRPFYRKFLFVPIFNSALYIKC